MARPRTSFVSKLTEAERTAVVRASVVDGDSSRVIADKAAKGELEGVGKVRISDSYVRRLTARHRADHSPEKLTQPGEADRARADARTRMLSVILARVDAWEKQAKTGEADLHEHDRLMRALALHEKQPAQRKPGAENDPPTDPDKTADDIVRALLERSNGAAGNGTSTATTAASLRSERNGEAERPPLAAS